MDLSSELDDRLSTIEIKHRKEKKELQAKIQALKKTAKNDKTKKKELLVEISRLEIDMDNRHKQELEAVQNEKDNSLENQEPLEEPILDNEIPKLKISKAQKRRDKKSQLERDREEEIKLQEKENQHGPRNKEIQEISSKLKNRNLKIYSIPSDGDCLYKAVAHQMLISREQTISAQKLREDVATYMRQNKDDFLPFMTDPDTYEMLTDQQFEQYCNKIATTNMWGGQLEIRALSSSLKCPINVIQATGPECIEQGSEFSGQPLIISYHRHMYRLGEHYNSTCILSDNDNE
jgi:OTU domain-containing protein 6